MQSRGIVNILTVLAGVLFIAGFLFVSPDPRYSTFSGIFIILLALPAFGVLLRWLGALRGVLTLVIFSSIALFAESVAVATGYPYGQFSYTTAIGPVLSGLVPVTVACAYLPILLGAASLSCRGSCITLPRAVLLSTVFLVLADLVIDPAAVSAGFWVWSSPGAYYGIPISNFIGWTLTGVIYSWLFLSLTSKFKEGFSCPPPLLAASLLLIMALWSGYLFRNLLLVPAGLGLSLAIFITWSLRESTGL